MVKVNINPYQTKKNKLYCDSVHQRRRDGYDFPETVAVTMSIIIFTVTPFSGGRIVIRKFNNYDPATVAV